jgi:hypothetical protein
MGEVMLERISTIVALAVICAGVAFAGYQYREVHLPAFEQLKATEEVMKKVFLGGTCNESNWRNRMMIYLYQDGLDYFNPVVPDWTESCMAEEIRERETCDFCLYTITPKMTGVYSIAEVVDDSNKRPDRTVLVLLRDDGDFKFSEGQWKSLGAVAKMVTKNGGKVFDNLKSASLHMAKL